MSVVPLNLKIEEECKKFEEHEDFLYKTLQRGHGLSQGAPKLSSKGLTATACPTNIDQGYTSNLHLQKPEQQKSSGRYGFFGMSSSAKKPSANEEGHLGGAGSFGSIITSTQCAAITANSLIQNEEGKWVQDKSTTGGSQEQVYDNFNDIISKHKRHATIGSRLHLTGSGGKLKPEIDKRQLKEANSNTSIPSLSIGQSKGEGKLPSLPKSNTHSSSGADPLNNSAESSSVYPQEPQWYISNESAQNHPTSFQRRHRHSLAGNYWTQQPEPRKYYEVSESQATSEGLLRPGRKKHPITENPTEFMIDPEKAEADGRTTVMIRNIPNKYTKTLMLQKIDEHFQGQYNFFYLPIDFKVGLSAHQNQCNMGYAFLNFVHSKHVKPFYKDMNNKKWEKFNSEKVCNITYGRIQGLETLISHLNNSNVMTQPVSDSSESKESYRPYIAAGAAAENSKVQVHAEKHGRGRRFKE